MKNPAKSQWFVVVEAFGCRIHHDCNLEMPFYGSRIQSVSEDKTQGSFAGAIEPFDFIL